MLFTPLGIIASNSPTKTSRPITYTSPEAFLLDFMDKINKINNQEKDISKKTKAAQNLLTTYIDVPLFSRRVLRRNWRRINSKQKREFTAAFSDYLIVILFSRFRHHFKKESFKIKRVWEDKTDPGYYTVISEYKYNQKTHNKTISVLLELEWKIVQNKEKNFYKIRDIKIEGISFASNYYSQFNRFLTNRSIDDLITALKEKANQIRENEFTK